MLGPDDTALEIGAGPATLTRQLAETGARIIAIEVDRRFEGGLAHLAKEFPNLNVMWGNVLDVDWIALLGDHPAERCAIVGNIPYQITAPIMARMATARQRFSRAVLMVQREVAERLIAPPGSRTRSALSVKMALDFKTERVFNIGRKAFRPPPKVDSALIRLTPLTDPPVSSEAERTHVRRTVEAAFGSRRQQLVNSLPRHWPSAGTKDEWRERLIMAGLEPTDRAERIPLEGFLSLARTFEERENSLEPEV